VFEHILCASRASTGLCGGRRVTVVPTATAYTQAVGREDFFDRRKAPLRAGF
jgi:hypothetical protein